MKVQIDEIAKKTNGQGGEYFTFSLTLVFEDYGTVKTRGWRYFSSTGTVAAPARKAGERYTPTVWLQGFLYDDVKEEVPRYFISLGLCEEPWEEPTKREPKGVPSASDKYAKQKHETQEQRNERLLDAQAEARRKGKK